ncbi:DUF3883 domain-containing protein [Bacillus toyonensis]|uniref:Protein NO VEIN C-terminal domain-containing protein n=1 Tax=Bacillus toyonensis TaxID=155322 RepID=A0A2C3PLY3_9BACI|nr:DUF3883 domain-containing protein [Bacillus toyonensis]PEJ91289.1 hypothetical protein CN688_25020 [Bacillus toyonensis]PEK75997.1 hypothetical protein CN594_29405 [Bacillus toyonensis]PEL17545.1 hypothetical protein CN624_29695 [Bacillus toyonensis]PFY44065.1 hypothetical protein COL54_12365 [Bacillus toyonensis]PFY49328.1 hypothetical protein COL55_12375 [Bacillus toyonensis]
MDSVNKIKQEITNQQIIEILSNLTEGDVRNSEHIRNSLQTHIDVLNAHLIEGLEHREIDELILNYPVDSDGNVITNGSISSRILYWLGIKGKESRKSIFLGIFANKSLKEIIEILKDAKIMYKEKQKINMIINLFQIRKLANDYIKFRELLSSYDRLYMKKVNSFLKITAKARNQDSLLKVLLESRTLLAEVIELENTPNILREMALRALQIIKSEQILSFEGDVQELIRILGYEIYFNNIDAKANTALNEADINDYNISIKDKNLIEIEPPFSQEQEDDSQQTNNQRRGRHSTKRNYEREQRRNKIVGYAAEVLVLNIEKEKLNSANRADLAQQVEHVSETQGDGLGYDIKSFEIDGTEIYIEVKGTSETVNKGFLISDSEVRFSIESAEQFYLYRVYDLNSNKPKYFKLKGPIEEHFDLIQTEYFAKIK